MSLMVDTELGLLPNDWKLKPLGDLLYIKGRIGWKGLKKSEYLEEGYAIINGEQIKNDDVNWESVGRISKERYLESPEITLKKDDILMTKDGTIGKIAYINELSEDATVASGVFVIRKNSNILSQKYLYNFFSSHYFKWLIKSRVEGSVIPHLYQRDFKEMLIPLPSYKEQNEIAELLNSFSNKIKLLQQQNSTLEILAQTIFKEWFNKYQIDDKLPDGWRIGKIGDIVEIKRGGSPRPIKDYISDSGYRWLKISDASATQSPYIFNIKEHIRKEGLKKTTLKRSGDLVLSNSATPGIPKFLAVDTCVHDGWMHFPSSSVSNEYLYLLFQSIRPRLVQQGSGSVFVNLKTDILRQFETIIPPKTVFVDFDKLIKPFFDKIYINATQIQSLTETRDTLLPKLMSGQVRVKM